MNSKTPDPFSLFYSWYPEVYSPEKENSNAVILSTATSRGRVSSRVVLLKEYDRSGFVFFTNYNSIKGRQLAENAMASLLFYWPDRARQIRIEGLVEKTSEAESDNYFNSRKPGHKINAMVSNQSEAVDNIDTYMERQRAAQEYYRNTDPERPSHWGGYRLIPDRFEFWEEGADRFHTRQEFLYEGDRWVMRLLQP